MPRTRAWRRARSQAIMWRRLKDDWNEHYNDFACPCRYDPAAMRRMMDTPKRCSGHCVYCCNRRALEGPSIQELRQVDVDAEG